MIYCNAMVTVGMAGQVCKKIRDNNAKARCGWKYLFSKSAKTFPIYNFEKAKNSF